MKSFICSSPLHCNTASTVEASCVDNRQSLAQIDLQSLSLFSLLFNLFVKFDSQCVLINTAGVTFILGSMAIFYVPMYVETYLLQDVAQCKMLLD